MENSSIQYNIEFPTSIIYIQYRMFMYKKKYISMYKIVAILIVITYFHNTSRETLKFRKQTSFILGFIFQDEKCEYA